MNKKTIIIAGVVVFALVVFVIWRISSGTARSSQQSNQGLTQSAGARDRESQGDIVGARQEYQRLIEEFPNSREVLAWQKKIQELKNRNCSQQI